MSARRSPTWVALASLLAALALLGAGCGSDETTTVEAEPAVESSTDEITVTESTIPTTEGETTTEDSSAPDSLGEAADQIRDAVPEDQRDELYQDCIDRAGDSEGAKAACETILGE